MVQMSKTQAKQVDPAVEEVLASIRKIMAIDEDDATTPKQIQTEVIAFPMANDTASVTAPTEGSDVLTLTEMIDQDGSVVSLGHREETMVAKTDKQQANANDVKEEEGTPEESTLEEAAPLELQAEMTDEELPAPENIEKPELSSEDIESIMSPEAVEKSALAFDDLNKLTSTMQEKIETNTFGNQTLDQLMREMLKPLLKDWLDAHLPSLVKWLVAEKIEQMIREKQEGSKK